MPTAPAQSGAADEARLGEHPSSGDFVRPKGQPLGQATHLPPGSPTIGPAWPWRARTPEDQDSPSALSRMQGLGAVTGSVGTLGAAPAAASVARRCPASIQRPSSASSASAAIRSSAICRYRTACRPPRSANPAPDPPARPADRPAQRRRLSSLLASDAPSILSDSAAEVGDDCSFAARCDYLGRECLQYRALPDILNLTWAFISEDVARQGDRDEDGEPDGGRQL